MYSYLKCKTWETRYPIIFSGRLLAKLVLKGIRKVLCIGVRVSKRTFRKGLLPIN